MASSCRAGSRRPCRPGRSRPRAARSGKRAPWPAGRARAAAGPDYYSEPVTRNLALELVRVTEAAALAGGKWLGRGDKNKVRASRRLAAPPAAPALGAADPPARTPAPGAKADGAAVDAMRRVLSSIDVRGRVIIGEGEKDEAPMLYCGEEVGSGAGPRLDVAVDPLDGTSLVAYGRGGAIAVMAMAEENSLFDPGVCVYMDKICVGAESAAFVDIDRPPRENIAGVAMALKKSVGDVEVAILDRPRHEALVADCRAAGARVKLISDGDVAAAIAAADPASDIDMLMGIGGSPEGVLAACAMRCMHGSIQAKLWPRDESERERTRALGADPNKVLSTRDLCRGEVYFAATGVSDGPLLRGVRFLGGGGTSHSIVMRSKSGTCRRIETYHRWDRNLYPPAAFPRKEEAQASYS